MRHKHILAFFAAAVFFSVLVRILQIWFVVDPGTGFFKRNFSLIGSVISISICAAVLFLAIICTMSRRMPKNLPVRTAATKTISLLLCGSLLIDLVFMLSSGNLETKTLIFVCLTALCAVFFAAFPFLPLENNRLLSGLSLLPVLHWLYRLVLLFINLTGIAHTIDHLLEMAMITFTLLFFLLFSKVVCGTGGYKNARMALPVSLISSLFCFVCTVPIYFIFLTGNGDMLHQTAFPGLTDFFVGVFCTLFILQFYSKKNLPVKKRSTRSISTNSIPDGFIMEEEA